MALICMLALIGWLKWPVVVAYAGQQHQIILPVLEVSPAPMLELPVKLAPLLAEADREMVALQNRVMQGDQPNVMVENAQSRAVSRLPANEAITAVAPTAILRESVKIGYADKVLFCGDSLMQGLVPFLMGPLKSKKIKFKNLSRQSTGLAYPGFFDWPKTVREEIEAKNVTVLVIFVGANDAWDIIDRGKMVQFNSPSWKEIYTRRVESIAAMAEKEGVRVIWVALPPMANKRLANRAPVLNDIYRQVAARYEKVILIPASDVLTDDGVTFTNYRKSSASGEIQRLRGGDGIHLAPAGNRLLAELIWSHVEFF